MSIDVAAWLGAVGDGVAQAVPTAGAFAQHVSLRTSTGSTNDDVARAALEGAPEGYTVIAAEQTAGRGRRGASWHSPAAHGLYLSTLLRPDRWAAIRADPASPAASLVTLMAGMAVASAIRDIGDVPVEVKWPNDVMVRSEGVGSRESGVESRESAFALRASAEPVATTAGSAVSTGGPAVSTGGPAVPTVGPAVPTGGPAVPARPTGGPPWRKLAGILAEGASDGGVPRTIVVGVGLNVQRSEAPADVAARMIALDDLLPSMSGHVDALVRALVAALLVRLREGTTLLADGLVEEVRERWLRVAPSVRGTRVRWQAQGVWHEGHADGIAAHGALRVRVGDDALTLHGGDVEWLLEARHP